MLNHITINGRLTGNPVLRMTQNQTPVATFTVACERDYTPKGGGKREVDFLDVVAWGERANFVDKYFTKGSAVIVDGRLEMRDWTDNSGNKRRSAEINASQIYFGESKRQESNDAVNVQAPAQFEELNEEDGELPF